MKMPIDWLIMIADKIADMFQCLSSSNCLSAHLA